MTSEVKLQQSGTFLIVMLVFVSSLLLFFLYFVMVTFELKCILAEFPPQIRGSGLINEVISCVHAVHSGTGAHLSEVRGQSSPGNTRSDQKLLRLLHLKC